MHVIIIRYRRIIPGNIPSKNCWLGVCADLSKTLDIPVVVVRFYILLYKPFGLGLIFYFIYYCFILKRVPIPLLTPKQEIQITKIKIYYFGS